jgi:hypothetical protein
MMKIYKQHREIVVDEGKIKHVMALLLNPVDLKEGVVRCIVSLKGNIGIKGFTDRSVLYRGERDIICSC